MKIFGLSCLLFFMTTFAFASDTVHNSLDYAQVQYVKATQSANGTWCFNTQVRHNDEGWEHYADAWQVVDSKGDVLAERVLFHPHDNEQPFTRSVCGVNIPSDNNLVTVRAKCNLHGFGGQTVTIDLARSEGKNYSVVR
ncbi:hypothetical protein ACMUMQ_14575 [Marinomonas sp. 2405UD66-6]|uniref:hypothetical protein n=1 Tax=Marinomonas sp. 2405UD66-6 TaxID=3391834 RepID=UPI0039C9BFA5